MKKINTGKILHYMGLDRKKTRMQNIAVAILFISCTVYSIFAENMALVFPAPGNREAEVIFILRDFATLILAGSCGTFYGVLSVFIGFIVKMIMNGSIAYITSVLLLSALAMGTFAHNRWFASRKKTILAILIMGLIIGVVWGILLGFLGAWHYSESLVINLIGYFWGPLFEILIAVFILKFFFLRAPQETVSLFPMGKYYRKKEDDKEEGEHVSKIGKKVTLIILTEILVICVGVIVFCSFLFPSLVRFLEKHGPSQTEVTVTQSQEEDAESEDSDLSVGVNTHGNIGVAFVEWVFGAEYEDSLSIRAIHKWTLAEGRFITKLLLLLMNLVIPIGMITDYLMRILVSMPISDMDRVMSEFYSNEEANEDRLEQLKYSLEELDISSNDEIEELYCTLLKTVEATGDYVEHKRIERELEEKLLIAKKSSEAKSNFLSNMSHEIRTPINAVLGMDEMILRETREENTHKYAVNIQNSGKSLLSLINDILDFSKIEAGKMEITPVDYDLSSVINDLVNLLKKRAEDKGLEFRAEVNPDIPYLLHGDDIRLKQCITNILTNAVKYTKEGSVTLKVDCSRIAEAPDKIKLKIHVKDTGIGIKEEDIKKLYSPFERIEEERNRTIEGTGLGMNITRQLLYLMGSEMKVESVYGKGSDFSFEVKQDIVKDEPIGDFTARFNKEASKMYEYRGSFCAPKATVLVVDDTEMNLTVIEGLLKQTLIQVETVTSGYKLLDMVVKKHYDIIFVDHRMPGMDGIETLKAVRKLPLDRNLNADTPFIALTANAISGAREMYLEAGFSDYLSKPVDSVKLENMIMEYLPDELLHLPGSPEYEMDQEKVKVLLPAALTNEDSGDVSAMKQVAKEFLNIDIVEGLKNCAGADTFGKVFRQFSDSASTNAEEIEEYFNKGDIKNYTIKVHAVKSSARVVGALELSEMAKRLETAGNEGDLDTIKKDTAEFLRLFRSYGHCGNESSEQDEGKPLIEVESLEEAFQSIKEFTEVFDHASVEAIMEELGRYKVPDSAKEKYNRLKELVRDLDRDSIIELLT